MRSALIRAAKKIIPSKFHPRIKKIRKQINIIKYLIDSITFKNVIKKKFFINHGYRLNLKDPKSYNEKIIWKKLYDRNPLMPFTTDKYKVRQYIEQKLGKKKAKEHLIPLLYVTRDPGTIQFDTLPDEFIIKPNHASNWFIIAEIIKGNRKFIINESKNISILDDSEKARIEIIKICKKWLNRTYGILKSEWAYQKIKSVIIIEKLLRDRYGKIPNDYKFCMFHGECKLIYVSTNRLRNVTITCYDNSWNLLNVRRDKPTDPIKKPEVLNQMISLAEKLSQDFDFVRIDLYLIENNIYCGEITHYPTSGYGKITPTEFDFKLGEYWKLK